MNPIPRFFLLALVCLLTPLAAAEGWIASPDHEPRAGVPRGTVTQMAALESKIFPGMTRDWWIYIPAQYQPDATAAVMVFQDGKNYLDLKGPWRAPTVFDNLIARGEMPVTVAIFINFFQSWAFWAHQYYTQNHAIHKNTPQNGFGAKISIKN